MLHKDVTPGIAGIRWSLAAFFLCCCSHAALAQYHIDDSTEGLWSAEAAPSQVDAANFLQEAQPDAADQPSLPPTIVEEEQPELPFPTTLPENPFEQSLYTSPFFAPPTEGYRPEVATTGTLLNMSLMETPLSVQVVPQDVLQDQRVLRIPDALRNVSGIQQAGSGGFGENFVVRGFEQDFIYRNGFREPREFAIFQGLANVQQVEVLKGPGSVLYGRIEPGGVINILTKKPLAQPYASAFLESGSYGLVRTWFDATGPVDSDGAVLYRVNAGYDRADSFRDFVDHETMLVAPVVTMNLTERLQATVEYEYYNDDRVIDQGIVALGDRPAPIPRSRFLGEPRTDFLSTDSSRITTDLLYDLGYDWAVQYHFVYDHTDRRDFRMDSGTLDETTGELERFISANNPFKFRSELHALNLTGHVCTGPLGHRWLVGADYRDTHQDDIFGFGAAPPINIFNPTYGFTATATPFPFQITDQWSGVYFQDLVEITDQFKALIGGRYDNVDQFFGGLSQSTSSYSPRYALLYQPYMDLSFYTTYAESTSAQQGFSNVDPDTIATPETAEQFEVGMKFQMFEGLFVNLAGYELRKENIAVADPLDPFFVDLIGAARSRGVELDVTGQLTPNLQMIGTYAYTDTEITRDTSGNQGNRLPNAAYNTGSLWMVYDFAPQCCDAWVLGGGVFAVDDRAGDQENSFVLPGYGIVNLMAQRRFCWGGMPATLQLNVDNVLDKTYFVGAQNRSSITVGTPVQAFASLRLEY